MTMNRRRLMLRLGKVLTIGGLGALGFEVGFYYLRAIGRVTGEVYPEVHPVALMSVAVGMGLVVFASLRPTNHKDD